VEFRGEWLYSLVVYVGTFGIVPTPLAVPLGRRDLRWLSRSVALANGDRLV
jgi:hypothetical protein